VDGIEGSRGDAPGSVCCGAPIVPRGFEVPEPDVVEAIHSKDVAPFDPTAGAAVAMSSAPSPPPAVNAAVTGIEEIARPFDDVVTAVVTSPLPPTSVHEGPSVPILVGHVDASVDDVRPSIL